MNRYLNMIIAVIILVGAFTASAQAQSASQKVIANVPFAFNVGTKNLPAGKYTITVLNPSSDRKVLQIRSNDGRSTALILTTDVRAKASDEAKLVFRHYGDRYFFAQAQMAGETSGLAALKSSLERAQKQMIGTAGKNTVVIIAE